MKFIKDLEILTPERIKEVEQKYNNMFYVVRTYYTDPFYKHFYQKYVDGKVYNSKEEAVDKIRYLLRHEKERKRIAENGQRRTLENYTYYNRIEGVIGYIQAMV